MTGNAKRKIFILLLLLVLFLSNMYADNFSYLGITQKEFEDKEISTRRAWTYRPGQMIDKTAMEWSQHVVPGRNPEWNRFEGPLYDHAIADCIVLHGSYQ